MSTATVETIEYPRGLRERQRMQREASIIEAAFVLIIEKGYEAMTMDDLAERVGISKPTLYNHFASKEAIAVRTLVELNERAVEAIRAIDSGLPPMERLGQVVRWMIRNRLSPVPAAFVRARPAILPLKTHPDYVAVAGRRIDAIAEIVEAAQEVGEIDAAIPPKLLAQVIFNVVCTPEYDDLLARGEATLSDVEETVLTVIFRGVRLNKSKD